MTLLLEIQDRDTTCTSCLHMPSPYLSKSDFKACFDCRTKLFYRKHDYATNLDENEYLRFLADGGFMIETVAKAQYPAGIDLVAERDPQRAFVRTQQLLSAATDAVVFEAAALWQKFYARIDILRREGDTLHLIEVKIIGGVQHSGSNRRAAPATPAADLSDEFVKQLAPVTRPCLNHIGPKLFNLVGVQHIGQMARVETRIAVKRNVWKGHRREVHRIFCT